MATRGATKARHPVRATVRTPRVDVHTVTATRIGDLALLTNIAVCPGKRGCVEAIGPAYRVKLARPRSVRVGVRYRNRAHGVSHAKGRPTRASPAIVGARARATGHVYGAAWTPVYPAMASRTTAQAKGALHRVRALRRATFPVTVVKVATATPHTAIAIAREMGLAIGVLDAILNRVAGPILGVSKNEVSKEDFSIIYSSEEAEVHVYRLLLISRSGSERRKSA